MSNVANILVLNNIMAISSEHYSLINNLGIIQKVKIESLDHLVEIKKNSGLINL
jgi:hypothetical protein